MSSPDLASFWPAPNALLQLTLLYEEVLYTIFHRLGKPEPNHVADPDELYAYVQKVRLNSYIHLSY